MTKLEKKLLSFAFHPLKGHLQTNNSFIAGVLIYKMGGGEEMQ